MADDFTECPECGLLQRNPALPPRASSVCARCGCVLHRDRPDSLNRTLALTLAALVLFVIANSFPFLSMSMQGQVTQTTLVTGILDLYDQGQWQIAAVVAFTSLVAPGLQLALLLVVLITPYTSSCDLAECCVFGKQSLPPILCNRFWLHMLDVSPTTGTPYPEVTVSFCRVP